MSQRYYSLSIFLIFALGIANLYSRFEHINISSVDFAKAFNQTDTESRFATGLKIKLSDLERFDLELIAGIPQDASDEIIKRKNEIILKAISLPTDRSIEAFQIIHGIGPEKAKLLGKYIELK